MGIINLDVNYDDVKDTDQFPTVPTGTYDFLVRGCVPEISPKGKHKGKMRLNCEFGITDEDGKEHKILHSMYLPSLAEPELGGGSWGFVAFTKSIGMPWEAGQIDTDEYIGASGSFDIVEEPMQTQNEDGEWVDDPEAGKRNRVKKFYPQS